MHREQPEAEFLDVIWTKVFRVFTLIITVTSSPQLTDFTPPPPEQKCFDGLKLVCNVNIVYGNLRSENSQDYDKPQRNCTFMNSSSGKKILYSCTKCTSTYRFEKKDKF